MTTSELEPPPLRADAAPPAAAQLASLRRRARLGIQVEAIAIVALLLLAFAAVSLLIDRTLRLELPFRAGLLALLLVVVLRSLYLSLWRPLRQRLDDEEMALAVERRSPGVRQALISSLQFARDLRDDAGIGSRALKAAVVDDVRQRVASIPFATALDAGRVRRFAAAAALVLGCFIAWLAIDASSLGLWLRRNLLLSAVEWPRYTQLALVVASDGTLRLPQGDALTLRIAVTGEMPDQAFVDYRFADGENGTEPLSRTGDREFTWTIESVLTDAELAVQAGDSLPLQVKVTIVERPRVSDLELQVAFPAYMEREPTVTPATEGELRLPKGAVLTLSGRSQKPLSEAFALFANDQKTSLPLAADGLAFRGELTPSASGLLVVDVIDRDQLGAATPPKLLLRVGDDKAPTIEFRLQGIGSSITAHARIPGDLKVRDDFGLREVAAVHRVVDDKPLDKGQEAPPEPPFVPAGVVFGEGLTKNQLRYETTASIDLRQWNVDKDEAAASNPIRPGMLLSLRLSAKDNFGPGEAHEGVGETMTFRVVTRAQLTEDLRRRQIEQRTELQTLLEEQQRATLELQEMVAPADAGDRRKQVEARLAALTRQQQALGRRVAFVGESYQRILWEYENNRLIESNQVREIEAAIPVPLQAIGKESFPAAARAIAAYSEVGVVTAREPALIACRDIEKRLLAILAQMKQAESLAALIEELKGVIRVQQDAIRDTEGRARGREDDIFKPRKPAPDTPSDPDPPKKK